ncbi:MAG TPA: J domain-containing protein, partial [Candidatus Limnocylindrales bacterium]
MPDQPFRGDPYRVLDVAPSATDGAIKRRWRELAREHHPDRAAGDREEAARLTGRMARINAAYDLLRDPGRRARFDASAEGRRAQARAGTADERARFDEDGEPLQPAGPPPPPRTTPVTARFDTTAAFRPRNTPLHGVGYRPAGQPPVARPRLDPEEL